MGRAARMPVMLAPVGGLERLDPDGAAAVARGATQFGIPQMLSSFFVGDAIPNVLPMPLVILAVLALAWLYLKNTRLGTAIYAVGSDPITPMPLP